MKKIIVMTVLMISVNTFASDLQSEIAGDWCSVGEMGMYDDFNRIISMDKDGNYKTVFTGLNDFDSRTKQVGYISVAAGRVLTEPSIVGLGKIEDLRLSKKKLRIDFESARVNLIRCPKQWSKRIGEIFK